MKAYGWFGLVLLAVSEYCMLRRIEPFHSWFYSFAWWSYILLADNLLLKLRGTSVLTTRRRELAAMFPLSVAIWLVFEAFNFVLQNWAYKGVPAELWLRWPGYTLAFATVLPGVFITSELVAHTIRRGSGDRPVTEFESSGPGHAGVPALMVLAGASMTIAPLIWPRYFFPAVWVGPIFLLDPFLEMVGRRSLFRACREGDASRLWSLLAGGLACGILWEFWNFWAAAKWVYSVPFFDRWKIFEMPALGFLGFPPFAVECWILYHLLDGIRERSRRAPVRLLYWAAIAAFCGIVFLGMDRRTVLSFVAGHPTR
jgi:hypothetical protein